MNDLKSHKTPKHVEKDTHQIFSMGLACHEIENLISVGLLGAILSLSLLRLTPTRELAHQDTYDIAHSEHVHTVHQLDSRSLGACKLSGGEGGRDR